MNDQELTVQDVKDAEREGLEDYVLSLLYAEQEYLREVGADERLHMLDGIIDRFRIRLEPREDER